MVSDKTGMLTILISSRRFLMLATRCWNASSVVSHPVKMVHLEQSTCHTLSGQGAGSTRIPDG
jgi:hypothetical protein